MPFPATWMELEIVILSQTEKAKYDITHMWNQKKKKKEKKLMQMN